MKEFISDSANDTGIKERNVEKVALLLNISDSANDTGIKERNVEKVALLLHS
jgi:hypothetical protein